MDPMGYNVSLPLVEALEFATAALRGDREVRWFLDVKFQVVGFFVWFDSSTCKNGGRFEREGNLLRIFLKLSNFPKVFWVEGQ